MMLIFHIAIALSSIIYSTFTYFSPSYSKLRFSYGLVVMTFATGTYLILQSPSHLAETCITGLIYLGIVAGAIFAARRKLALQAEK